MIFLINTLHFRIQCVWGIMGQTAAAPGEGGGGGGGCQGAELASSSTSMVQRIVGESALASDSQNSLGLMKVGHMSIPPRFP